MKRFALMALAALLMMSSGFAREKQGKDGKAKTEQADKKSKKDGKKKKARKLKKLSKKQKAALAERQKAEAARRAAEAKKPQIDRPGMMNVQKVKGQWFFELPDSLLGKDMLVTTRYVSTPGNLGKFGGEMCNEQVVYFEFNNDTTLLLRCRMTVNVADTTENISKAISVSNENPIIAAFRLAGRKDGKSRFRVDEFFNSDNALGIHSRIKTSFRLAAPVREACYVDDIKSFPTNTEVRLVKTYNSSNTSLPAAAEVGKATFVLNVSFVQLPEVPMATRFYDPRVGYFTHGFTNYSDQQQRVEQRHYISRWRLEPRPEDVEKMRRGELVEPIKPIVFYIDPATPQQWRKYLIQGVNDWQVAFEKAGFKNAIYGLEWPEGNDSTMSMEDARYSVIRYLASPIANAYGPHVSDPRTGEILESHICWYHNVMQLVHDWYMVQAASVDEAARQMNYDEELMGQLIRFVSSHEVGHALGLRHNFGSSAMVPVDSLRNKAWVEKYGHTPSIMDYARFNYVAQPEDGIGRAGIFPRINDYDLWAIQWGYQPMLDATDPYADHEALEAMTQKAQENKRLWWGDGEGYSRDPRRQSEDLGDDPMKAGEYGIRNMKYAIANLEGWTFDERDIFGNNLATMYDQYQSQYLRYMGHVARYIGGYLTTYRTREQGGTVYEPTPLERQKAALDFLNKYVLQEPAWFREAPYAKSLNQDPRRLTLNIAGYGTQYIMNRLNSANELYPAEAILNDIVRMAFTETQGGKISLYRETVQNVIVDDLRDMFRNNANAMHGNAMQALQTIRRRAKAYAGSDAHTRAHFQAMVDLIDRTLVVK